MTAYQEFAAHIASINDLLNAASILTWDLRTQMPPGGAETRAHQLATLSRLAQERFTSDLTARLLDAAEVEVQGQDPDSYPVRAVRQTREAYVVAQRIPPSLLAEMAAYQPVAQQVWVAARAAGRFDLFVPTLERMLDLARRMAEAIGYEAHPYDALLLRYEPGMTAAQLESLFAALKARLQPLLRRIMASGVVIDDQFLRRPFAEEKQRAFALEIAQAFGYDLQRGRLDTSAHPFEVSFTRQDVRMTTRYDLRYLPMALFGVFHETGHALYEQGVDPSLTRSALTTDFLGQYAVGGTSYGAHESQSRLWENLVGRSRAFWVRHFPQMRQKYFGVELRNVTSEMFYRAVNQVKPSLIRVEADEVTYNFHILLRVELEMAMLDGRIAVRDLPALWNERMRQTLGVTPPNDALGVLQDMHWSSGSFGSFATYTIGNVMSVQLFEAARRQMPGLDAALGRGDYAPLREWLTANMYRHGRAFSASEILTRATGRDLDPAPYLDYLENKYLSLYQIHQ